MEHEGGSAGRGSAACPACGGLAAPDARFCARCGTALPAGVGRSPHAIAEVDTVTDGEERKVVTVLFADVTGFTGLGEALDPEVLRTVMAAYFAAMRQEVIAAGGTVEKFIGDAVVAIFGVPQAREDDAARALRCALAMQRRLDALAATFAEPLRARLAMRIGINTGEVLARTAAGPEEGLVTGDAVTVAARLEQMAEPGRIVVAERTAHAARGFRFADLGPVDIRGRAGAVRATLLEGLAPDGVEPHASGPFVGRDEVIERLAGAWDEVVRSGRPRLVLVRGDAGAGKSRLAQELVARLSARPDPGRVLRARCRPPGEAPPWEPLGVALRAAASLSEGDPRPAAVAGIADLLARDLGDGDAEPASVAISTSLGLTADGPLSTLPPRQVRYEIHRAWRAWLRAVAAEAPTVLVIEDLHWADPELLDFLEDLVERVEVPLFVLALARPEIDERAPGWGRGPRAIEEIALSPLGAEAAAALVHALPGGDRLSAEERRRIVDRADGIPFFLEELVRSRADPADGDRPAALPDTVQAVLAARIDRLPHRQKRTLQLASVAGRTFPGELVEAISGLSPEELEPVFAGLVAGALLLPAPAEAASTTAWAFRHALIRDVAYESLPRRERARTHARVAAWLEAIAAADRGSDVPDALAHHLDVAHGLVASDPTADRSAVESVRARAFRHLLDAAAVARRQMRLDAATRYGERADALAADDLERSRALEALGEAYLLAFWGDRAWATLRRAALLRAAATPEDARAIARLCAEALETPTRWGGLSADPPEAEARELLELGLRGLDETDSEERARLLVVRSMWPRVFGDAATPESRFEDARRDAEAAASMALRLDQPDLASGALDCASVHWYSRGRFAEAEPLIERRIELIDRLADPREVEDVHAMAAWVAFHRGHYRAAMTHAEAGVARTIHVAPETALHSLEWRAVARAVLGDWDGTLADIALAGPIAPPREDRSRAGFRRRPWAAAALIHEVRGEPAAADGALAEMSPLPDDPDPDPAASWLALLLARRGHVDEALALLEPPEVVWRRHHWSLALAARCDIVGLAGRWELAEALVSEARDEAERGGSEQLLGHADRLAGRLASVRGDAAVAVGLLQAAADRFARLEAVHEAAQTQLELADVAARSGRGEVAAQALDAAVPVLRRLRVAGVRARVERLREAARH